VARGFTGEHCLGRTLEILGHALPRLPELRTIEELAGKVASLLGALASGYAAALGHRTLDEREAWFREVFHSTPVGMVISRPDGTVTRTNSAVTKILRYPPGELAGRDVKELFHPDDAVAMGASYQALIDGKRDHLQSRSAQPPGSHGRERHRPATA
jgi:PAS domain S-box-containing protein